MKITFVGAGTGVAYVMGFSHLHENVEDEFRGRTFAALIALLRTGLLGSLAVAVAIFGLFWTVMAGAESPTRDEKILVGVTGSGELNAMVWDGTSWTTLFAPGATLIASVSHFGRGSNTVDTKAQCP